jgi:hypothetical protein
MVSPEYDWWIKNVTEVKHPVYNRKQYEQGVNLGGNNDAVTTINQDENIKLVFITDILLSFCGNIAAKPCDAHKIIIVDNSLGKIIFEVYVKGDGTDAPIYLNQVNYIQEGERLNISAIGGGIAFNKQLSVGYISVSSKT